jgi:hypothetical protein
LFYGGNDSLQIFDLLQMHLRRFPLRDDLLQLLKPFQVCFRLGLFFCVDHRLQIDF